MDRTFFLFFFTLTLSSSIYQEARLDTSSFFLLDYFFFGGGGGKESRVLQCGVSGSHSQESADGLLTFFFREHCDFFVPRLHVGQTEQRGMLTVCASNMAITFTPGGCVKFLIIFKDKVILLRDDKKTGGEWGREGRKNYEKRIKKRKRAEQEDR